MKVFWLTLAILALVIAATAWMYSDPSAFTDTGAHRGDLSWFVPRYGQGADGCIWMPWGKNLWRCW